MTPMSYLRFQLLRRFHSFSTDTFAHRRLQSGATAYARCICNAESSRPFHDPNPSAAEAEAILQSLSPSQDSPQNLESFSKAARLAKQAAEQGSARGKTILGSMHREGLGVIQDTDAAAKLFQEAAEAGDPIGQCSLGALMLSTVHKQKEHPGGAVAASELMVELDEKGEPRARLALEMEDGSVSEDAPTPAELVRRVRKARRKAGFSDDQAKEFEEHKERERLAKFENDRKIATDWLEAAIEQGNDAAMVLLANEILHENPSRAVDLFKRAVQTARNTDAYFNLGQIYTEGMEGIPVDHSAAAMNFAMAAQLGDASAQFYLGHLYRVGSEHVKPDEASARQYIELAAEQGHPAATYYLALMHLNGEGGLEASEGAFKRYLSASAELAHGPAHAYLGEMYYKGTHNTTVNYEKALGHFKIAGELGESEALCSAAAMHFRGLGTAEDQHEAFLLYQKAAELGSLAALRNIGAMYFHGHGVPVNKSMAERFFRTADDVEKRKLEEAKEHASTPIRTTEAPKHPMQDVPRELFQESLAEDMAVMNELSKKE